ncbi:MAG TPA: extracellular solute-binding protein [Candidatus Blautia faecipullorum]|nr:extracellular solute-binding protein [Candidatus Blautia faecipullorum]
MKGLKCLLGICLLTGIFFLEKWVPAAEVCADTKEEKITLRMMYYWGDTDSDISARYLKEILENDFPQAFPDVELIQETCDNETYKKKLKILMASDEIPDIMISYGGGFSENFVKAGKVLPLDGYLDDFYKERMDMEYQQNFIFDEKVYGICYANWKGVLYCNTELFEKAGAELPETYGELLEACEKLRAADVEPIALGILNKWQGQQWINNFTIQLGGADYYKAMAAGEESLDNDVLLTAAELTVGLIEADAFCADMYQLVSGEAEEMFLDGEAAMIYIGSWFTQSAEESLGNRVTAVKMPLVPGAKYPQDYHGGGSNGWIVSADTRYPETAVDIIEWLSYELSCYQPENSTFVLEEGAEKNEVGGLSREILEMYSEKEAGGIAWDSLMNSDRAGIWLDSCAGLFEKRMDGRAFIEELSRAIG